MRRICIVTPDIIGPVRNGGIGSHCYWLSKLLAEDTGCRVTVLFTGHFEQGTLASCRKGFARDGIDFHFVDESPGPKYPVNGGVWFVLRSQQVYEFCCEGDFDVIHFQDWHGNGFIPIQAKRSGLAFANTVLTVTMHSPSRWIRDGMVQWPRWPIEEAKLEYTERYCCEHADWTLSPSAYMFTWASTHGFKLAPQTRVLPCLLLRQNLARICAIPRTVDAGHLAFFGRLETRKGLALFCRAVDLLLDKEIDHGLEQISFVGKVGEVEERLASDFIAEFSARWKKFGIHTKLITDQDSFGALRYLKQKGAIAIIASYQDNFPYTVSECVVAEIPFLASAVGGIGEMVSAEALFEPSPAKLMLTLAQRQACVAQTQPLYDCETARIKWAEFNRDVRPLPEPTQEARKSRISVCIAYYNYGDFLPQLLRSLKANTDQDFEVVVVDDGSTKPACRTVFDQQKKVYSHLGWKFVRKANEGIGATRNFAVEQASGDYIIFMDADNLACEDMVSTFRAAVAASGVDCLTCHFLSFEGNLPPRRGFSPVYGYMPLGACAEVGVVENVFGDANMCVKKSVFRAVGGFSLDRGVSFEDWELLAKIVLAGYQMDVVPKTLFLYRHSEAGFSRTTNLVKNFQRVARPYDAVQNQHVGPLVSGILVPLARQMEKSRDQIMVAEKILSRDGIRFISVMNAGLNRYPRAKRVMLRALRQSWNIGRGVVKGATAVQRRIRTEPPSPLA